MNCFEIAPDLTGLEVCQTAVRDSKDPWGNHFDGRYRMNVMRVLLGEGGRFEAQKDWDLVFGGDPILNDNFTGFDYKAEWSLVRAIRKYANLNESVFSQLTAQFSDVNFRDFVPSRTP